LQAAVRVARCADGKLHHRHRGRSA
jgi:hypothetical protein